MNRFGFLEMKYSDENIIGERSSRNISPKFELESQQIICESILELMTMKGIYQNIDINFANVVSLGVAPPLKKKGDYSYSDLTNELNSRPWQPISKGLGSDQKLNLHENKFNKPYGTKEEDLYLNFYLPEIITYCNECKKETTFLSMASSGRNFIENIECVKNNFIEQYFVFHYKCGLCKNTIINFLIKRYKNKITLCGRSERLHFNVSKITPKKFRRIINDAISAANENDIFAGFYHLRTFVEHFVKDFLNLPIESQMRGDDLLEKYNKDIGGSIIEKIPSLSQIYSELSANMHRRKGDKNDFDLILQKLIDHLKAKELFDKYSRNI